MAKGVKMEVVAWTFHPDPKVGSALALRYIDLPELLRTSDIVSLHLRATPESRHFLSRERLALLKPTAYLINTARGALIDEAALVEWLRERRIAGAALDVFETEPLPAGHPFAALPNVLLTSHCAGMTPDSTLTGLAMAAENIADFLKGAPTHVVAGPSR